jgi:rRNA-processing protein FCF1
VAQAVVLDTNAWLLPFTEGTNLETELGRLLGACEWVIPSSILGELKQLSQGEGALARNAKSALRLAQRARVESTALPGDDGLLEVARKLKAVVVSNDRLVQAEAVTSKLQVVVAREGGRLAMRRSASGGH